MSASTAELQEPADRILELCGRRQLYSGQIVIHYNDGVLQRVEVNSIHKPAGRRPAAPGNGRSQE